MIKQKMMTRNLFLSQLCRSLALNVTSLSPAWRSFERIRKRSTRSASLTLVENVRRVLTDLSSWRPTWQGRIVPAGTLAPHAGRALAEKVT